MSEDGSAKRMMVKSGCADLRMWQRVKDGCRCREHPPFTHRTQARLWTNKRCIKCINLGPLGTGRLGAILCDRHRGTLLKLPYFEYCSS